MGQITSREELEAWLKDKPIDFAQVITARAVLCVLPYAFGEATPDYWVPDYWVANHSLALFRATLISWAARNFPAHDMAAAARAASGAAYDTYGARANGGYATNGYHAAYAAAYASRAAANAANAAYASRAAARVANATNAAAAWANINHDCDWFTSDGDPASASRRLTREKLWPAGEPDGWAEALVSATGRIAALNQGYSVWIDWYNRRIEGHDAAFDIPGDTNRIEDKAILARLADATNEDFWDKGATYVNTTLQGWIDEARERAAIDYVASGVPLNLGSDAELAARNELAARLASVEDALAALKDQLASLTQTGHGEIGHNQPENATSLRDDEIITLKQQVASLEILVTGANAALTQPEPDIGELVQLVPKLNRWGRMMQAMEDVTSPKVREGLETWAGPATLGAVGYLASTTIPNALAAFSHYFYTYWIPILIG